MEDLTIQLLDDIPEKGRNWKKGMVIYGVELKRIEQYINEGRIKVLTGLKEPKWRSERDEEE